MQQAASKSHVLLRQKMFFNVASRRFLLSGFLSCPILPILLERWRCYPLRCTRKLVPKFCRRAFCATFVGHSAISTVCCQRITLHHEHNETFCGLQGAVLTRQPLTITCQNCTKTWTVRTRHGGPASTPQCSPATLPLSPTHDSNIVASSFRQF